MNDTEGTDLAAEFNVNMICSNLALVPLPSLKAGNESAEARQSFQSRNEKVALQSSVMNNILVILTDNYIVT